MFHYTGWTQDPDVNEEELITLHLTPCDRLEGPSKANMEGYVEETNMGGQAEPTDIVKKYLIISVY